MLASSHKIVSSWKREAHCYGMTDRLTVSVRASMSVAWHCTHRRGSKKACVGESDPLQHCTHRRGSKERARQRLHPTVTLQNSKPCTHNSQPISAKRPRALACHWVLCPPSSSSLQPATSGTAPPRHCPSWRSLVAAQGLLLLFRGAPSPGDRTVGPRKMMMQAPA